MTSGREYVDAKVLVQRRNGANLRCGRSMRLKTWMCFQIGTLPLLLSFALNASSPHTRSNSELLAHTRHRSTYCYSCERDGHGRIKRNSAARRHFIREHPCPSTGLTTGGCPGYIVDHKTALKRGGQNSLIEITSSSRRWSTCMPYTLVCADGTSSESIHASRPAFPV